MVELRPARVLHTGCGLHRGMAGARRLLTSLTRPGVAAGLRGRGAPSELGSTLRGRRGLACLAAGLACLFLASAEAQVLSSRIWPARDYTRLTLESKAEVKYQIFAVKDPERLVLDLETEMTPALAELDGKVAGDDPYIKGLRVARNRPGVVRVVLDLKAEVKPQAFTLSPIAEYGHRLVLDIHPLIAVDPLAELIAESAKTPPPAPAPAGEPSVARLATIVIDAGHGGEDPGAIGRRGSREKDITLMIARRLKALVDAEPNMRPLLTRHGDYFLPLNARVEQASFAVLKAHDVPSILVETAFISNPQEEKRLNDQRYQDKLARALLDGIRDFVAKHPPRPASPLARTF